MMLEFKMAIDSSEFWRFVSLKICKKVNETVEEEKQKGCARSS